MSTLANVATEHADNMVCIGLGLEAIADLLGGGSEHALTTDQVNGLHHAVLALARMAKGAGYDLAKHAEGSGA
ncbi:hypothetical protein [Geopseudomonas aromaticivorans]